MQVFKFGGTSVGSPARMQQVSSLIDDGERKIVVLSAVGGTTNKLVLLGQLAAEGRFAEVGEALVALREEYESFIYDLFEERDDCQHIRGILDEHFQTLERTLEGQFDARAERRQV